MPELHDIELLIRSQTPLVVIETYEEPRALQLLTRLAARTFQSFHAWSTAQGLVAGGLSLRTDSAVEHEGAEDVLRHLRRQPPGGLIALCDLHPYLTEPTVVRLLKDIALSYAEHGQTLFLVSHRLNLPPELQRLAVRLTLELPSDEELFNIVREEVRAYSAANAGRRVRTDRAAIQQLIANLRGVTHSDARRLIRSAIVEDGALTLDDVPDINQARFALMNLDSVLSYEYETAAFGDVGGLDNLKKWLAKRQQSFVASEPGLDSPKGVLLLGVQGGGKSLAAKAVAGLWHVPLLRLDIGALYNKYQGESERNLREALTLADRVAPCVLWMDEIEKAMAVGNSDGGTSKRLLGTLLTWMAERKSKVFLVATSNDIRDLPPELMRKGRMDEIFFVDLPNHTIRQDIFRIHLAKRVGDHSGLDLVLLAEAAEGYSGAEIEAAVVSGLYHARARKETLATHHVLQAIQGTQPISVVRAEDIQALRHWASERAVPA